MFNKPYKQVFFKVILLNNNGLSQKIKYLRSDSLLQG